MPSEADAIIRVTGGYFTADGKFWPTGGPNSLLQAATDPFMSSWDLGPSFLNPDALKTPADYQQPVPTVTQSSSVISGGSFSSSGSNAPNDAFDSERNAAEQYGVGMVWGVQLPNLIPDVNNQVSIGGLGSGSIAQSIRSPSFWLQVLIILVGGLLLWFLTGRKAS